MEQIKILYVEDDLMFRQEIANFLREKGFDVLEAEDGESACTLYDSYQPHVIVLDIDLPGINGFEVMKYIHHKNKTVPIGIYSGQADEVNQIKNANEGGKFFVIKQYSPSALLAYLQQTINENFGEVIRLTKDTCYNLKTYVLEVKDKTYTLSPLENRLFSILCKNKNQLSPKELLYKIGWQDSATQKEAQLNKHITSFRQKLSPDPDIQILNEKFLGFRLLCK